MDAGERQGTAHDSDGGDLAATSGDRHGVPEPAAAPIRGRVSDRPSGPVSARIPGRIPATLAGARHPVVGILLLMSFFTVLSGKPVDGLLLFAVASALSWDAGVHARRVARDRRAADDRDDADDAEQAPVWQLATKRPARLILLGVAAALSYAIIVGSFTRYSWPATFGVVALGALVVIIGWNGPIRHRVVPAKFRAAGALVWGGLLVSCGLWELSALLMQPDFETASFSHPTISTLTDPLLMSTAGRAVALLTWIGIGLFLVLR